AVPIHDARVWNTLSFTSSFDPKSNRWTGKIRTSLNSIDDADGNYLENFLLKQQDGGEVFPVDQSEYSKLKLTTVQASTGQVTVSVPSEPDVLIDELPV